MTTKRNETRTIQQQRLSIVNYLLVFSAAGLIFANTFDGDFVYDDGPAIVQNADVVSASSSLRDILVDHDFWGQPIKLPGSHKSWRPMTSLTFRWNHQMAGLNKQVFHVTNIFLHGVVSSLVMMLCSSLGFSKNVSMAASLLFAVHPIHCEAVASIVGRAELLCALFTLGGLLYYMKTMDIRGTSFFTLLAVSSKETGIMLPVVAGAWLVMFNRKSGLQNHLSKLLLTCLAILMLRLSINGFQAPSFSSADNPLAHETRWLVRVTSLFYLPVFHLKLLVFPYELCFDWSMDAIPPISTPFDRRILQMAVTYSAIVAGFCYVFKRSSLFHELLGSKMDINGNHVRVDPENRIFSDRLLFAFCLLVLPFLPASNLFSYVGFVAAERVLYLPSVGYCIMVAVGLEHISKRFGSLPFWPMLTVLLAILSLRTISRNVDWKDEMYLYSSAAHINPAKAFANLGHVLASAGRTSEAASAYTEALKNRPNMADTWYNLGILHNENGNRSEAIHCYRTAVKIRRNFAQAHLNLGLALLSNGRTSTAKEVFINCTQLSGTYLKSYRIHILSVTSCHYNLGRLYAQQGKLQTAVREYEKAVSIAPVGYPSMTSLLSSLGDVLSKTGNSRLAEEYFQKALMTSSEHLPSLLAMSQLRINQNRTVEALEWLERATTVSPMSAAVFYQKGQIHTAIGSSSLAENSYRSALSMDGDHVASLQALAMISKQRGENQQAEQLFARVSALHASVSSYSNFGAILHLNGKLAEAEGWYQKALEIDNDDVTTKENLQKVRRAMEKRRRQS